MIDLAVANKEVQSFPSLNVDKQVEYLFEYPYDYTPFHSYILGNKPLLDKVSSRAFATSYGLEKLDAVVQNKIIFDNLAHIKSLSEIQQRGLLEDVKDRETYRYLFQYLRVVETLELLSPNNILGFIRGVKDDDIFLTIYNNPNIFNRLMQNTKLDPRIETFWYPNFGRIPIRFQEYILKDLRDKKEYKEQYEELYENSAKEARNSVLDVIPSDFIGQIDYFLLTHDAKAKEAFMAGVKSNLITNETFMKLLSLYPEYLSIDDMTIIIARTSLYNILGLESSISILQSDNSLKMLIREKIKKSSEIPYYIIDKIFIFCAPEDKTEILDKISKNNLLSHSDVPDVMAYINSKLAEDENYLKDAIDMSLPQYARAMIPINTVGILCPYLSDEAFVNYAPNEMLDTVILKVEQNPDLMPYVSNAVTCQWLNRLDTNSPIIHHLPASGLINSFLFYMRNPGKRRAILDELYDRSSKGPLVKNEVIDLLNIYRSIDASEKEEFIIKIDPCFLLGCYAEEKNNDLKELIAKTIIEKQERAFNFEYHTDFYKFLSLPENDINKILDNVLPIIPINLYLFSPSKLLESIILRNFNEDPYSLNKAEDIDELVYSLGASARDTVGNTITSLLNDIKSKDSNLYELLSKNDSYSVLKFIERYNMGFFNNEVIYRAFVSLLHKYPFITMTINYEILSPELINLNSHFLDKIVKYPDVQARIINIKNNKAKSYPVFLELLNHVSNDEDRIFDDKMLILLDYFEKNEVYYDHHLNNEELENLLRYILLSSKIFKFSKDSLSVDGVDPLRYSEQISEICDKDMQKANSEFDIKNAIFKKYFDITYEDAKVFLYTYDNDLDSLDLDEDVKVFVDNIRRIASLKNIRLLYRIYQTYSPRYSINDMFIIINELQKAYAKKINESLTKRADTSMQISIGDEMVRVVDAGLDFKVLTHSTNAYSSMPMVDDDYYKSWNIGKNLTNHGICTALVTDTCLGLPPLRDEKYGVIFGFNHLAMGSISNMGPYDLFSVNSGYRLETNRVSKFMSPNSVESNTRHTHNEIVLERTNLEDNTTVNIQPDYVIITSEMSDNQKKNSLMAARQMNKGKGIPILYIDIARIVANKKDTIINLLSEFINSKDIKTLSRALSLYESVKCTLFNIKDYDFITTEFIDDFITKYIEYVDTLTEKVKIGKLQELEKALNQEKAKFDLVVDSGNRHKTFDIDYNAHIENIYSKMAIVNLENDTDRLNEYMKAINIGTNGLSAHDETHMVRVTMLAQKIAEILGLDEKNMMMVIEAAKNHDKGRVNDGKNVGHGKMGAIMYKAASSLDEKTTNMICAIIEYHEPTDDDVTKEAIFDKYNIPLEDRQTLELLCSIVKDADALDRVRFTNPKAMLDPKKLRLNESKLLIKYANDLLNKTRELSEEDKLDDTLKA